jgi:hypothetical protein
MTIGGSAAEPLQLEVQASLKARVVACYQAPSRAIARRVEAGIRAD